MRSQQAEQNNLMEELTGSGPGSFMHDFRHMCHNVKTLHSYEEKRAEHLRFQNRISSAQNVFNQIGFAGQASQDETAQTIGVIGSTALQVFAGYTEITSVLAGIQGASGATAAAATTATAATAATSTASQAFTTFADIAIPGANIALAAYSAFNYFKNRKKQRGQNDGLANLIGAFLQSQRVLAQLVLDGQAEMREGFRVTLTTIRDGFNHLEQLNEIQRAENYQYHEHTTAGIERLEAELLQNRRLIERGVNGISSHTFSNALNKADAWIEGSLVQDRPHKLENIVRELTDMAKLGGLASLPIYNGAWLLPERANSTDSYRTINDALRNLNPEEVSKLTGFLADYIHSHLRVTANGVNSLSVFNPKFWNTAVNRVLVLRTKYPDDVLDPNHQNIGRLITAGENQRNYLNFLRTNAAIYEGLFNNYQDAVDKIKRLLTTELDARSVAINEQITQRYPVVNFPNREMIQVDIKQPHMNIIAAYDHAHPVNSKIQGKMIDHPPLVDYGISSGTSMNVNSYNPDSHTCMPELRVPPALRALEDIGMNQLGLSYGVKLDTWGGNNVVSLGKLTINIQTTLPNSPQRDVMSMQFDIPPVSQMRWLNERYDNIIIDSATLSYLYHYRLWNCAQFSISYTGPSWNGITLCNAPYNPKALMENYWLRRMNGTVTYANDFAELNAKASILHSEWLYEQRKQAIASAATNVAFEGLLVQLDATKRLILAVCMSAGFRPDEIRYAEQHLQDSAGITTLCQNYLKGLVPRHHDEMPQLEIGTNVAAVKTLLLSKVSTDNYFENNQNHTDTNVLIHQLNLFRITADLRSAANPRARTVPGQQDRDQTLNAMIDALTATVSQLQEQNAQLMAMMMQFMNAQRPIPENTEGMAENMRKFGFRSNQQSHSNSGPTPKPNNNNSNL